MLVDDLSGYLEVFRFVLLPTSATIIHKLTDFWKSSAWYPQSNGAAERAVQSFKRLYSKKEINGTPWESAWALWRDRPQEPGQLLSARLLFG